MKGLNELRPSVGVLLSKAVFYASICSHDLEGERSKLPEEWEQLLKTILTEASENKWFGEKSAEEILEEDLNDNDDLESVFASFREKSFWEDLVSHIVGKEIDEKNIALDDEESLNGLYDDVEKRVGEKGLDALK